MAKQSYTALGKVQVLTKISHWIIVNDNFTNKNK